MTQTPVKIAVTGAAGQICYSLLFRIASGSLLGDTPIELRLLEITPALKALEGVVMELDDCAFGNLVNIEIGDDPKKVFDGVNAAFLVGAMPRKAGMERSDLLTKNGAVFTAQGKALNAVASRNVKVLVVGNPANTNAYIAMKSAPDLPAKNFTAMLRLDHNRAASQLAAKAGFKVGDIKKLTVWGNHSPTMYADYRFATIGGESVKALINDEVWNREVFLPTVGKRGAAIIEARGLSSAASAANALIDRLRGMTATLPGHAPDISQDKTLLWLMAIACGLCAGANYYCQPLIYSIHQSFQIPQSQVALTVTFAQVSYALGLLFIVPMGDIVNKTKFIHSSIT